MAEITPDADPDYVEDVSECDEWSTVLFETVAALAHQTEKCHGLPADTILYFLFHNLALYLTKVADPPWSAEELNAVINTIPEDSKQ